MNILGIVCSHDGTLSFVQNGKNIFSLGEERINRVKSYIGFPFAALRYALKNNYIQADKIDAVAIPIEQFSYRAAEMFNFLVTEDKKYYDIQNDPRPNDYYTTDHEWKNIRSDDECRNFFKQKIKNILLSNGINAPIYFYDHHLSHAACAYYSSGLNKALAITMDGEGDGLAASVNICEDGKIKRISATPKAHSPGYIYSAVTKQCGFKMSRHEGKITGLAAYGDPSIGYDFFAKHITVKDGSFHMVGMKGFKFHERVIRKLLKYFGIHQKVGAFELIDRYKNISNADLSACIQKILEDRIAEITEYWIEKTGIQDVVVAGGVFANVKFNQRIGELPCVKSLYVYPDMGDGGTAYGAAMLKYAESNLFKPAESILQNTYLGPKFSDNQIETELQLTPNIEYQKSSDIIKETAKLIADKKIVGWFQGGMEYGPRALGHRSILATPTDSTINKWLNERMKRTEFMPFAPSCLYEFADDVFDILNPGLKRPSEFMTITFQMKPDWAAKAPAVSHIDQTARPQLVRQETNPLYYQLLKEFYSLTGLPLFINTSFNVHEEPIVCTPKEAIKGLTNGMIDVLSIGSYIVKIKD